MKYNNIIAIVLLLTLMVNLSSAASTPNIMGSALTHTMSFTAQALSGVYNNIQMPVLVSVTSPVINMSLVIIIVSLVIVVAAFVYILASIINSHNAKNWAKIQIYEALLSVLLIIIFIGIFYIFLINPSSSYNSAGLLPPECNTASINTMFNLSACDIGTFSNNAMGYFEIISVLGLVAGESPGGSISYTPATFISVSITATLGSVLPDGMESMLGTIMSGLLFLLVLNNLQLILISGSILFLTFFITIGLFARLFGITRTFGGAMIAFGVGLGVIYPLLISITYGFVDSNMLVPSVTNVAGLLAAAIPSFIAFAVTGLSSAFILPPQLTLGLGYVVAGLTFIPFLNFIILDAFIVDFSRAIGEKVSFMALLSNFI